MWYTRDKMEKVEIFENTKKFCKHWWRVYSPRGFEYQDYEQECAVVFFEKLVFAQGDEAIALAQKAYKWKLLDMMRKNDDTKISYVHCEIVGHEYKYFSLDDIGLNEVEKKICEGVMSGYVYKELGATKRQIMSVRQKVGDYFEIAQKNRSHNAKYSEETCKKRKEQYKKNKEKLLMAAALANKRPVVAFKNEVEVLRFDSLKEAAIGVELKSPSSIRKSINGLCKAGGYNWQYA